MILNYFILPYFEFVLTFSNIVSSFSEALKYAQVYPFSCLAN